MGSRPRCPSLEVVVSSRFVREIILACFLTFSFGAKAPGQDRTRLIILADMGNEPDEMQQMTHMLVCSNSFDLEGLIPGTGKFQHPGRENPRKRKT